VQGAESQKAARAPRGVQAGVQAGGQAWASPGWLFQLI